MFCSIDFMSVVHAVVEHFTPHGTRELIGVVFGILVICCGLVNYIFTDRKKIFIVKAANDIFSGTNHFCYGRTVPMVICIVALFREYVFYNRGRKKWADRLVWLFVFIIAMALVPVAVTLLSGGTLQWIDALCPIGSAVFVYALYSQNNIMTKACIAVGQAMYVIYDAAVGNIAALVGASAPFVSIIIGLVREINKQRQEKAEASVPEEKS